MPKGKSWTLTANRKALLIDMLRKQYTLQSCATEFGISVKLLNKQLKINKLDWKSYRRAGICDLRKRVFERLDDIDDPKDYVNAGMKVLDRYDTHIEDVSDNSIGSKDSDIKSKILMELSVE